MEIGLPCKWLYPDSLEGRKIVGEFTGTNTVKTKAGKEMEVAVFVCSEAEYQIAQWNLVCATKFNVESQKAELSLEGKSIKVKLL